MTHGLTLQELQERLAVVDPDVVERRLNHQWERWATRWARRVMLSTFVVMVALFATIRLMQWDVALGVSLLAPNALLVTSTLGVVCALLAVAATSRSAVSFWRRWLPWASRVRLEKACAFERSSSLVERRALSPIERRYREDLPSDPHVWAFGVLHHRLHGPPNALSEQEGWCHATLLVAVGTVLCYQVDGQKAPWPNPLVLKAWLDAQGPEMLALVNDATVHPWQQTLNVLDAWGRSERPSERRGVVVEVKPEGQAWMTQAFRVLLTVAQAADQRHEEVDTPSRSCPTLNWVLDAWFGLVLLLGPPEENPSLAPGMVDQHMSLWWCWLDEPVVSLMAAKARHRRWAETFSLHPRSRSVWRMFWRTCQGDITQIRCCFRSGISYCSLFSDGGLVAAGSNLDEEPVTFEDLLNMRYQTFDLDGEGGPDTNLFVLLFNTMSFVMLSPDEPQRLHPHPYHVPLDLLEALGLLRFSRRLRNTRLPDFERHVEHRVRSIPREEQRRFLLHAYWGVMIKWMAEHDLVMALRRSLGEHPILQANLDLVLAAYRMLEQRCCDLLKACCPDPRSEVSVQRALGRLASQTLVMVAQRRSPWVPRTQRWVRGVRRWARQRIAPGLLAYEVHALGRLPPLWSMQACWKLSVGCLSNVLSAWLHRLCGGWLFQRGRTGSLLGVFDVTPSQQQRFVREVLQPLMAALPPSVDPRALFPNAPAASRGSRPSVVPP